MNNTKKQFIISSKKLNIDNMQEEKLAKCFLYYDSLLNITHTKNANNEDVIILGNAFCTDEIGKMPTDDISLWNGKYTRELTKHWVGRWALIANDKIMSDACSLMSLFYYSEENLWIVSSSLAVMSMITNAKKLESECDKKLSWQILPLTTLEDVRKAMPFETLKIGENIEPVFENWLSDYREKSTKEKCEMIAIRLRNAISNIERSSKKNIFIALTSGKDSRQVVAAALNAQVSNFTIYTLWHQNISNGDTTIPKRIAADKQINYKYISKKKINEQKRKEYIEFTFDSSHDADEEFYARGFFDEFPKDAILIKAGLFELGQKFFRTVASDEIGQFHKDAKKYYKIDDKPIQKIGYEMWEEYIVRNPLEIDVRDRFYLEQRICGWAAAIDQSLDINDFTVIQIANCQEIVSLLLSANDTERENLDLPYGVIKVLDEELLEYPINPEGIGIKIRKWIGKKIR